MISPLTNHRYSSKGVERKLSILNVTFFIHGGLGSKLMTSRRCLAPEGLLVSLESDTQWSRLQDTNGGS